MMRKRNDFIKLTKKTFWNVCFFFLSVIIQVVILRVQNTVWLKLDWWYLKVYSFYSTQRIRINFKYMLFRSCIQGSHKKIFWNYHTFIFNKICDGKYSSTCIFVRKRKVKSIRAETSCASYVARNAYCKDKSFRILYKIMFTITHGMYSARAIEQPFTVA